MTSEQTAFLTKGNAAAAEFVRVFVTHCHVLDDIEDRDVPCDRERMMASETDWLLALTGNPFFLQHRPFLVPLIVQGFNAWLDSCNWQTQTQAKGTPIEAENKRIGSDVLKGFYHEVVWQVAFLCGGWSHLREVTGRYREYDFERGEHEQEHEQEHEREVGGS